MQNGTKRKQTHKRKSRHKAERDSVSITIPGLPMAVHDKIKQYQLLITGRDQMKYKLTQAYAEFLKEKTQEIQP